MELVYHVRTTLQLFSIAADRYLLQAGRTKNVHKVYLRAFNYFETYAYS